LKNNYQLTNPLINKPKNNMRIKLLLVSFACAMLSSTALFAGHADDFKVDSQQVQQEFADLTQLEQTVIDNDFITLSEIRENKDLSSAFAGISTMSLPAGRNAVAGIPGFWWGCVFGPIGLLVVYAVTDNDKAEVKSALTGCIVGTAVSLVFYLVWALAVVSTV
jgi:hypothetical protein